MRVLHLSTADSGGGAARGAYNLHRALATRLDSAMLVQRKRTDDPAVSQYQPRWSSALAERAERLVMRRYPACLADFSPAVLPRPVHLQVNALEPDLVNLHWINDGFLTPEATARIRAPLVWTLRDLWPLTGGCHYSEGCTRFEVGCGRCPLLHAGEAPDLSARLYARKARAWAHTNFSLVALSHWLADQLRRSPLFAGRDTVVIPNALDVGVFRPAARAGARAVLGLPEERRIILFGALNPLEDPRKGFDEFRRSLELLAQRADHAELLAVVFGPVEERAPELALETRYLGSIHDDARLAALYAAADVTVMPSLEEAFGKVAMESLACGTPVVCFDDSGPADIVEAGVNGYQARHGDVADLARGIGWVLDHPDPGALGQAGLDKVMTHYTYAAQAEAYERLYGRVLDGASRRLSPDAARLPSGEGAR